MGETSIVGVGKRARSVEISPLFDGYSGVSIYVGQDSQGNDIYYRAGDNTGRVLEIENDFGTQQMANNILASIRGYQYQPLSVSSAMLDPAAELGDGVSVNKVYSGVFSCTTQFGRLMASDIAAPMDEEIAHEYGSEQSVYRAFKRESRYARAGIYLNNTQIQAEVEARTYADETLRASILLTSQSIEAEVTRATTSEGELRTSIRATADSLTAEISRAQGAENNLSARISVNTNDIATEVSRAQRAENTLSSSISSVQQTANNISARVSSVESNKLDETYNSSSFGWDLNSSSFSINSGGNTNIFYADRLGIKIRGNAEVTGRITATSGYIGSESYGFTINQSSITNGKTRFDDSQNGVYIGTDGIALGPDGAFSVTSYGSISAKNLNIDGGSINIADTFRVDSYGNLYAESGTFTGSVYAGSILSGDDAGYFDGSGLLDYSIYGGDYGKIDYGTITSYNTDYGINDSLYYANFANDVFNGYQTASFGSFSTILIDGEQFMPSNIAFIDYYGNYRSFRVLRSVNDLD